MEIDIVQIISMITGGGGLLAGLAGWLKVKTEKSTADTDNFKKLFDESQERYDKELERMQKERAEAKKNSDEYRERTDKKIDILEKKIESVQRTNERKIRAINTAYRCPLPAKIDDCPVLKTLDDEIEKGNENKQ